jgi:RNA polymerase sigma-70 factor, ECF subfamily
MEGYPVSEVARMLECAEGTVKSRCSRGRERLAGLLRDRLDEPPARAPRAGDRDRPHAEPPDGPPRPIPAPVVGPIVGPISSHGPTGPADTEGGAP